MSAVDTPAPLLEVDDLVVHFELSRRQTGTRGAVVRAVDGISFRITSGRTFGIVGESGSGKTTTAQAVMGLAHRTAGTVVFAGEDRMRLTAAQQRRHRRGYQMIFQDPYSSLNPRLRADEIVREPLDLMEIGNPSERRTRVHTMLDAVGLRPDQHSLLPHQFSGGQRQRISIARALAPNPRLVVCDEPVSALDVAVQAQVLNLLARLQTELQLTYLFISHDLHVVRYLCDDIAVMYLGKIVEQTNAEAIFDAPLHPYTWVLVSSVPGGRSSSGERRRVVLQGEPPSPTNVPKGCRFAGRCPFAVTRCREEEPRLRAMPGGRRVACHLVSDDGSTPQQRMSSEPATC